MIGGGDLIVQRYVDILTDAGFKAVFGDQRNKDVLMDLLNVLLPAERRVEEIEYNTTEIPGFTPETKSVRIDLRCTSADGTRFIVEMQKSRQKNFFRTLFKNRKVTPAVPETPAEYVREELFAAEYLPDEGGSLFLSPRPRFELSADGNGAVITVTAGPAFDHELYCTDATGTRLIGRIKRGSGEFVGENGANVVVLPSATENEDGDGVPSSGAELYPDRTVVLRHIPLTLGGRVTYTLTASAGEASGSLSKHCFPRAAHWRGCQTGIIRTSLGAILFGAFAQP